MDNQNHMVQEQLCGFLNSIYHPRLVKNLSSLVLRVVTFRIKQFDELLFAVVGAFLVLIGSSAHS